MPQIISSKIQTVKFDVDYSNQQKANSLQDKIISDFNSQMHSICDILFSQYFADGLYKIPKLELNLGELSEYDLENNLAYLFKEQLENLLYKLKLEGEVSKSLVSIESFEFEDALFEYLDAFFSSAIIPWNLQDFKQYNIEYWLKSIHRISSEKKAALLNKTENKEFRSRFIQGLIKANAYDVLQNLLTESTFHNYYSIKRLLFNNRNHLFVTQENQIEIVLCIINEFGESINTELSESDLIEKVVQVIANSSSQSIEFYYRGVINLPVIDLREDRSSKLIQKIKAQFISDLNQIPFEYSGLGNDLKNNISEKELLDFVKINYSESDTDILPLSSKILKFLSPYFFQSDALNIDAAIRSIILSTLKYHPLVFDKVLWVDDLQHEFILLFNSVSQNNLLTSRAKNQLSNISQQLVKLFDTEISQSKAKQNEAEIPENVRESDSIIDRSEEQISTDFSEPGAEDNEIAQEDKEIEENLLDGAESSKNDDELNVENKDNITEKETKENFSEQVINDDQGTEATEDTIEELSDDLASLQKEEELSELISEEDKISEGKSNEAEGINTGEDRLNDKDVTESTTEQNVDDVLLSQIDDDHEKQISDDSASFEKGEEILEGKSNEAIGTDTGEDKSNDKDVTERNTEKNLDDVLLSEIDDDKQMSNNPALSEKGEEISELKSNEVGGTDTVEDKPNDIEVTEHNTEKNLDDAVLSQVYDGSSEKESEDSTSSQIDEGTPEQISKEANEKVRGEDVSNDVEVTEHLTDQMSDKDEVIDELDSNYKKQSDSDELGSDEYIENKVEANSLNDDEAKQEHLQQEDRPVKTKNEKNKSEDNSTEDRIPAELISEESKVELAEKKENQTTSEESLDNALEGEVENIAETNDASLQDTADVKTIDTDKKQINRNVFQEVKNYYSLGQTNKVLSKNQVFSIIETFFVHGKTMVETVLFYKIPQVEDMIKWAYKHHKASFEKVKSNLLTKKPSLIVYASQKHLSAEIKDLLGIGKTYAPVFVGELLFNELLRDTNSFHRLIVKSDSIELTKNLLLFIKSDSDKIKKQYKLASIDKALKQVNYIFSDNDYKIIGKELSLKMEPINTEGRVEEDDNVVTTEAYSVYELMFALFSDRLITKEKEILSKLLTQLINKRDNELAWFLISLNIEQHQILRTVITPSIASKIERLLEAYAAKTNAKSVSDLKSTDKKTDESKYLMEIIPNKPLFINNAGLILLSPYIKMLFSKLKVISKDGFETDDDRIKGIQLLHYLVTGHTKPEEPDVILNKIIVGLLPSQPLGKLTIITDEEKSICDSLLEAVIKNWGVLKSTSIDTLRATFLMRKAKLTYEEVQWKLQIENHSLDLLLDKLPWSFTTTKYPWMEMPIITDWR